MIFTNGIKTAGHVHATIEHKSGLVEHISFPNTITTKGREALAASLANDIGSGFNFYINRMLFGDGGYVGGSTKYVSSDRNGLFGITQASKPVISTVDPNIPSQAIFTSVLAYSEANGATINEMALQLATGDLYSMVTFPDLTKTSSIQVTFNWKLSFV
jgi:hypothetical protein